MKQLISFFVIISFSLQSCEENKDIEKQIQVCRNNVLITIPETKRTPTDLDKCPDFEKIKSDLLANLTLKSDSKIPVLFIYVGYKKNIKTNLEDTYFKEYKNEYVKNLNALAINMVNHITFKNGLMQLDGTTDRKIEIVLADFNFSDDEINNMNVSSISTFLNNPSIRNYVKSFNIKRIKEGTPPIVEVFITVGPEVASKTPNLTLTSSTDGFGVTALRDAPNLAFYKGMLVPAGLLHECFWHMISNGHQNKVLRFDNPNSYYFQAIKHIDNNSDGGYSIRSMFYQNGGTGAMFESGMTSFIKYNHLVNIDGSTIHLKLDTLFIKSKEGVIPSLEFQDSEYDGNANRKLWESKYNLMVLKYIDMFIASEYGK